MKTTLFVRRAVMLSALIALVVTNAKANAQPPFGGMSGWNDPNNPYNNPNSNTNPNSNGGSGSGGSQTGSGGGGGNSNGNGGGSGNGNGNGGNWGGGGSGNGDTGNGGGGTNPGFGPGFDGFGNSAEYAALQVYRVAHGALAAVAFAFLFPLGAILLRWAPGKAAYTSHWVVQVIAFILYVAAAGLGLYLLSSLQFPAAAAAGVVDIASTNAHGIIGIALLVALFFQPFFGLLHHRQFKRLRRRTWASHVHLWVGRLGITLGIVNGGLGLGRSRAGTAPVVAYAVVAAVMWILWLIATLTRGYKDARARKDAEESRSVAAKIAEDDRDGGHESRVHRRDRAASISSPPAAATTAGPRIPARNSSAYSHAAAMSMADSSIPSPPYTPGPHYEEHMAHLANLQRHQQRRYPGAEMQNMKEVIDQSDNVSIITASQDEMRRGQV